MNSWKRMIRGVAVVTMLAMVVGGFAAADPIQAGDKLPAAKKVVKKFTKAIGGKKAVLATDQVMIQGKLEIPSQGLSGNLVVKSMAPNYLAIQVEIPGIGTIRSGYNGEVGWSLNPMMGPSIMEGDMLAQLKREADFYSVLHSSDRYQSMETVEKTEFAEKMCWKLKLVTLEGDEVFEYYDVESGYLIGTESTQESEMGPMDVVSVISDYKEFEGLMSATRMSQKMGPGIEQVFAFDSIVYSGVSMDDFALPAEIEAMVSGAEAE